jgi:hypothetical protein
MPISSIMSRAARNCVREHGFVLGGQMVSCYRTGSTFVCNTMLAKVESAIKGNCSRECDHTASFYTHLEVPSSANMMYCRTLALSARLQFLRMSLHIAVPDHTTLLVYAGTIEHQSIKGYVYYP